MRLSASKSVLERRDVIIVATVSAIYGIGKPESYTEMRLILKVGDKIEQRDLISHLVRIQYERNDMEFTRGKFASAVTRLTCSQPNTRKWRSVSNSLMTKSKQCISSIR